ncbi:MAG TPA: aspartate carbamoyltransferase [Propionibacteriaceae bacterium]|nr:aspartate carbamoyltransferase [Propionibacteriaceae bacterium]HBY22178.1 aspartate carbamoyltransferase [Propionibacteriaceae bacterium]
MQSIKAAINEVGFAGQSFISINSMTNEQLISLFELGKKLELMNRDRWDLYPGAITTLLFFQPSTRTRMSFETAMNRLGGNVIVENSPATTSSIAKEESLSDMLRCVAQYSNIMVLRHPDSDAARDAVNYVGDTPLINGGWGHWEHPTQALLDLYTLYRKFGRIEGLKVVVASTDMIEARTGHSMAQGLARLGAEVTIASPKARRVPSEVIENIKKNYPSAKIEEAFDFNRKSFNELISTQDEVYLPGCSAVAGENAETFKKSMDDYFVEHETLDAAREKGHMVYVTHTLPRRAGEMDLAIDDTPNQLAFESILHSVSIRMALLASILG